MEKCTNDPNQRELLAVSQRVSLVETPLMTQMMHTASEVEDVSSLSQGMVHWKPPIEAVEKICKDLVQSSAYHEYGSNGFGQYGILHALKEKIHLRNKLDMHSICVTQGANQAIFNLVLALCDDHDEAILFRPYYFNHLMALQLCNVKPIMLDVSKESMLPEMNQVEHILKHHKKVRMVILCNPCNPTGVVWPRELVNSLVSLCAKYRVWLISDEAYEDFVYGQKTHVSPNGDHVINVYSFSKSFGMHGWRCGYIAYPSIHKQLAQHLEKIQDTIPICTCVASQKLAEICLKDYGNSWIQKNIQSLVTNRDVIWNAILNAGYPESLVRPNGSMFFFIPMPSKVCESSNKSCENIDKQVQLWSEEDEMLVVEWLLRKYKLLVTPGQCFGWCGYMRLSYANISPQQLPTVAVKLENGLKEMNSGTIKLSDIRKCVLHLRQSQRSKHN